MQVASSKRFTCTHTSKECGSSCQVTSTFLASEYPSHCGVILYVCMDSLTRRQGRVPQDELTCEATNQRKTVLQHLGDPQEGLNSVLEQRLGLMVPSVLQGRCGSGMRQANEFYQMLLSENYHSANWMVLSVGTDLAFALSTVLLSTVLLRTTDTPGFLKIT